jgi:hypothetical protein
VQLDQAIAIDAAAARQLADCFAIGEAALRRLAPDLEPVLWPGHFDIGISLGEINFGVSPGDAYLAEPYAYVGPWRVPSGPFWNAAFGAGRPLRDLPDVDAVLTFFRDGRSASS